MSGGGGKGGKQTTDIPSWAKPYATRFMDDAQRASRMEYLPFIGGDVAAINPLEEAAYGNIRGMADAFNMGGGMPQTLGQNMPDPVTLANGQQAYSSAPLFMEALQQAQQANPNYFRTRSEIINPATNDPHGLYGGQYGNADNTIQPVQPTGQLPEGLIQQIIGGYV